MKKAVKLAAVVATVALSATLIGCGGDSSNEGKDEQQPEQSEPAKDDNVESDVVVEIIGSKVTEDYEGNPAIVIEYNWTNNTEEAESFMLATLCKAFQDGIQLESAIIMNDEVYDSEASLKEIKPGASLTVYSAYVLDSESDVTIEVEELFGELIAEKTFSVK